MTSKNKIRVMELPGNQKISVKEVSFKTVREEWNEYLLSDGTSLRVKDVVGKIFLQVDDNGDIIYDEHGEPMAVIAGNQLLVTDSSKS